MKLRNIIGMIMLTITLSFLTTNCAAPVEDQINVTIETDSSFYSVDSTNTAIADSTKHETKCGSGDTTAKAAKCGEGKCG